MPVKGHMEELGSFTESTRIGMSHIQFGYPGK